MKTCIQFSVAAIGLITGFAGNWVSAQVFTSTSPTYFSDGSQSQITVTAGGSLSGYFDYAAYGAYNGQQMDIVVGMVDPETELWVGGTPQIILFFGASSSGTYGQGAFENLSAPWTRGTNFIWFESYVEQIPVTPTISEFETNPPTESGYLTGILGTVIVEPPPQPVITCISYQNTNIVLCVSNIVSGEPIQVLSGTNCTLAVSSWLSISTNISPGSTMTITNPMALGATQQYYALAVP